MSDNLIAEARRLGQRDWCLSVPDIAKGILNACADELEAASRAVKGELEESLDDFEERIEKQFYEVGLIQDDDWTTEQPVNSTIEKLAKLLYRPRAVQGAAPQAEAYDHCCNHPKCPGGSLCCCASEQRLRDCWNQWREGVAGNTKQAFRDAYSAGRNDPAPWAVAPAPSSTVDEDALAEVIAKSRGFGNGWTQIPPLTREAYREIARAVAEWLKGRSG